ncbi:MAG: metallophosphoesterase family protein [Deltaproteobacteria bacterium]|nr:metallophosphoesterase family protein [Deltaproteobacteria bacterium]
MKKRIWFYCFAALLLLQFAAAFPSIAGDYNVSDISLSPGAEPSQLNLAWHTDSADGTCDVKIAKKLFSFFPSLSSTFSSGAAPVSAGNDENGNADYYCKVTVTGLEESTAYVYRLGDGNGNWSDSYDYTSRDQNEYGFFFVADSQIGASGPKSYSNSSAKEDIAEYMARLAFPEATDEEIQAIVDDYVPDATVTDNPDLSAAILANYNAYKAGTLETADADCYAAIEVKKAERLFEQQAASANDTEGWCNTIGIMNEQFPEAAFIISGGDQVELNTKEWEYTGFFAPYELTSWPVAPTYASHDRGANFEYHFNLPNESAEYGDDSYGVGDYYFTHGNTLIMVLNMDTTNNLYPSGGPPPPPPSGGGSEVDTGDDDGDGVINSDDSCADTPADDVVDEDGCSLLSTEDFDGDGVLNGTRTGTHDECNNTPDGYTVDSGDIAANGCPYEDVDSDGIPDEIDRCNNTYGDLTVDEDGCADCGYLETDDELRDWIEGMENTVTDEQATDPVTGELLWEDEAETIPVYVIEDTLADFKASLEEHKAFIQAAIDSNPDVKWKIVVWHYSIYSAAMHSTDDQSEAIRYLFTPMLEELDIDVVLLGHDHVYTRTHQMLGNVPQTTQTIGSEGQVIKPTGILYLTASSSSGSKYYSLNCNIGDDTSDSSVYYNYADVYYENIPTYTYFNVTDDTLKLSTYSYTLGDKIGAYSATLIDEYTITTLEEEIEPSPAEEEKTTDDTSGTDDGNDDDDSCFIMTSINGGSSPLLQNGAFVCLLLIAVAGGFTLARRRKTER